MIFKNAKWIAEKNGFDSPVFRKTFNTSSVKFARLSICGLGLFEAYINGSPVSDGILEPAPSNYAQMGERRLLYPLNDVFTATRAYYYTYDVTPLLKCGENLLSVHLGNGFFNQTKRTVEGDFALGCPRLIYSLEITLLNGETTRIFSDETTLSGKSFVLDNNVFYGETQDLSKAENIHTLDFNAEKLSPSRVLDYGIELTPSTFTRDRIVKLLTPRLIAENNGLKLYDVGENTSGRICFDTCFSGEIVIEHSEELDKATGLKLDFMTAGGDDQIQTAKYLGDGKPHKNVHPRFCWQGFRYFSVKGEIENPICQVIHTDLLQTADFKCQNQTINTLLEVYIRTQLTNIHGCIPTDCPHRERLGYTGDGQITSETVMQLFDTRELYKKWLQDITDCQNKNNGHIQHTAPFFGGGGGPSGWGGAVVVIPYNYYKMFGDAQIVKSNLSAMTHYLDYMESRCENDLVVCEENGGWCLGDWCFEGCHTEYEKISAEYVNSCYLVKFYDYMLELNSLLELGIDTADYLNRRSLHAKAITRKFYNSNGDFCNGTVGANAFALDIGLGNNQTLENLVSYYEKMNGLDTGIFATEILIRLLANCGRGDLVFKLLSSHEPKRSFGYFFDYGLTTLPENWNTGGSHNHPMFGGCVKALFNCFLGIKNTGVAFSSAEISPLDEIGLGDFEGYVTTPYGVIEESVTRRDKKISITVKIPKGISAIFKFRAASIPLNAGENNFCFDEA